MNLVSAFWWRTKTLPTIQGDVPHVGSNATKLSNVEKLHYLREALTGKVAPFFDDVPITDCACDSAWKRVLEKFYNLREIVKAHFDAVFALQPITSETRLPALYNLFEGCVRNLQSAGENVESSILTYLPYSKIDNCTRRDFIDTATTSDESKFYLYQDISLFVAKRAVVIEGTQQNLSLIHISEPTRPY